MTGRGVTKQHLGKLFLRLHSWSFQNKVHKETNKFESLIRLSQNFSPCLVLRGREVKLAQVNKGKDGAMKHSLWFAVTSVTDDGGREKEAAAYMRERLSKIAPATTQNTCST